MKEIVQRFTALFLTFALVGGLFAFEVMPAEAASSKPKYDKTTTLYYMGTDDDGMYTNLYIENISKKIKKSSIKSSDKSILKIDSVSYSKSGKGESITIQILKAGTAKVSFKYKSKTYKITVKVKKYTNPAKTFKLSCFNSGKNLKSQFNKKYYSSNTLKKTKKKVSFTIKAASGWKLSEVEVIRIKGSTGTDVIDKHYSTPTSKKKTIKISSLKGGGKYHIIVTFVNKKNGASIPLEYYINMGY